ncbi:hypothetical protein CYR84_05930 [Ligilactobacillus salivarius]|nr:hypothetical protein CYR84_05930 [Ligilactobacillus salivarius]
MAHREPFFKIAETLGRVRVRGEIGGYYDTPPMSSLVIVQKCGILFWFFFGKKNIFRETEKTEVGGMRQQLVSVLPFFFVTNKCFLIIFNLD